MRRVCLPWLTCHPNIFRTIMFLAEKKISGNPVYVALRLCNKDPFTLRYSPYLQTIFPNSKFLFMVRDGRATVHSIITKNVSITGFSRNNYRQCLMRWNATITSFNRACNESGDNCLRVYFTFLSQMEGFIIVIKKMF